MCHKSNICSLQQRSARDLFTHTPADQISTGVAPLQGCIYHLINGMSLFYCLISCLLGSCRVGLMGFAREQRVTSLCMCAMISHTQHHLWRHSGLPLSTWMGWHPTSGLHCYTVLFAWTGWNKKIGEKNLLEQKTRRLQITHWRGTHTDSTHSELWRADSPKFMESAGLSRM